MKRPIVSIIIPVFNTAEYLPKCLDSLLNQTLVDLEIICVNDGSTDESATILDEYARLDQRVIVIHQKNAGSASARNTGLKVAKGIYIGFSDSDDYSEMNMYETLVAEARKSNADVVICGANLYPEKPRAAQWLFDSLSPSRRIIENYDVKLCFSDMQTNNFLWRTLIRTQIIRDNDITFDEDLQLGEDKTFLCNIYPHTQRISVIPDKLYNYCWHREGSLMDTLAYVNNTLKLEKHALLVDRITDYVSERKIEGESEELLQWLIPFLYTDFIYQNRNDKIEFAKRITKIVNKLNTSYLMAKLPFYMVDDYKYMEQFKDLQKTESPCCSIILYLDGNSKYIRERTLTFQEHGNTSIEFILVNNGVLGKNYEYIKKWMETNSNVRLYNTPEHLKHYDALNKGITLASGEYLLFLNSFDELNFEKLITTISNIANRNVDLCILETANKVLCYENEFEPVLYNTEWLKTQQVRFEDDTILSGKIFLEKLKVNTQHLLYIKEAWSLNTKMSNTEWFGKIEGAKFLQGIKKLTQLAKENKNVILYGDTYALLCSDFCKTLIRNELRIGSDYYINEDEKTSNQVMMIKTLYELIAIADKVLLAQYGLKLNDLYDALCYVINERQRFLNE